MTSSFWELRLIKKGISEGSWVNTEIDFNQNFIFKALVRVESSYNGKNDVKCGFLFGLSDIKYAKEQGWYRFLLYSNKKKVQVYAANSGRDFFLSENLNLPIYDSSDYNEMAIVKKGNG